MYDGDRLRVKRVENGTSTYYLRSTVLGGQIVAELNASGSMTRGFVYEGGQLLAVQQNNQVSWMHEDPVAKSKRVTNSSGNVVSTVELDPWGGDTNRSSNEGFQPRRFTSYDRDGNASDDAMHRRYNRWFSRFDQPDPYDGSYNLTNPQSFNRYSYVQNDPVNLVDPLGLDPQDPYRPPPITHIDPATGLPYDVQPLPAEGVTINISSDPRSGSVGGTESGPMEIETLTGGSTGAELVPQNAAQNPRIRTVSECEMFASIIGILASEAKDPVDFIKKVWAQFAQDKDIAAWGSTGFKPQFRDDVGPGNSPNQVRHYVGALWVGAEFVFVGNFLMNLREMPHPDFSGAKDYQNHAPPKPGKRSPSQLADIALNAVATAHGEGLMRGGIALGDIANRIRSEVCGN
jgi:RHS repeat-associated protein